MTAPSVTSPLADILIVDDTLANLRLLSEMLNEKGYNVRKAINGQMALNSVRSKAPHLILLDVNMPDMNGYQVCKELKAGADTCDIPVIFVSALDDCLDKVQAFEVGGVDYVTKPFAVPEVLARIEMQLTVRRLSREQRDRDRQLQDTLDELKLTQAHLLHQAKIASLVSSISGIYRESNDPMELWKRVQTAIAGTDEMSIAARIESAIAILEYRLTEKSGNSISIAKNYAEIPQVSFSTQDLGQALFYLFNNAIASLKNVARHPNPTIWVEGRAIAEERLEIQIRNNGAGVSDEVQARLFHLPLSTQSSLQSPGLELFLAHQIIVQNYNGTLRYEVLPDESKAFVMELPVNPATANSI
ncbi:response regulator [Roseofilum casamattae]|uniref:Response regulator n=1 Tax=Roseofilum casamattae BLCC-M143 TaxID=3022442 RepID=A0ABT7BZW0_9CYAN|nr:response regulator [Roseofilum casamattae]MDJ1184738.1 response regulator [Roseofilum casamattae BLCC-M143]